MESNIHDIITVLLAVFGSYVATKIQIAMHEERIKSLFEKVNRLEKTSDAHNDENKRILERLATIESGQESQTKTLAKIEDYLKILTNGNK